MLLKTSPEFQEGSDTFFVFFWSVKEVDYCFCGNGTSWGCICDGSDSTLFPVNIEPAETSSCIGKSWPVTDAQVMDFSYMMLTFIWVKRIASLTLFLTLKFV